MWQVVTAPADQFNQWVHPHRIRLPQAELDELIAVVEAFAPDPALVRRPPSPAPEPPARKPEPTGETQNVLPFKPKVAAAKPKTVTPLVPGNEEFVSTIEMPRSVNALAHRSLNEAFREQLTKLRASILLAAEAQQLKAILLCGVDLTDEAPLIAAHLGQSLSEYERLKIAYIEVGASDLQLAAVNKARPMHYTFRVRRTQAPNLFEITSSQGAVKLDDWLKWWNPAQVVNELKKAFDLILINAPALNAHPDVVLLASAVDGVILIATEHVTSYASLEQAHQCLMNAQANVLGVTLNEGVKTQLTFSSVKARVFDFLHSLIK